MKVWSLNNVINIFGAAICIILFTFLFLYSDQKILIGVLFRVVLSLLILYNAIYLIFSSNPSFIIKKGEERNRKLCGIILLVVGIFGFITALMGYGINGYPLLDWITVL